MKRLFEKHIKENDDIYLDKDALESKYLQRNFGNAFNRKTVQDIEIYSCNNIVGVLKAGNSIFRVYPKIDRVFEIFKMIEVISQSNYLFKSAKKYIYFDPKTPISIMNGNMLTNELVEVLLNEIEKVRNIGYTKQYARVEENSAFLRGKINIRKNLRKNIIPKKFFVNYNRLDYGTYENLLLYHALNKILYNIPMKKKIKEQIIYFKNDLEILLKNYDLTSIFKVAKDKLILNRINSHYNDLINICFMFLERKYYSTVLEGESMFCNFLIKTDIVYERYIFLIIKSLIDEYYPDYYIEEQVSIRYINQFKYNELNGKNEYKGNLLMIPDIIIYKKDTKVPILVIDTKYINVSNGKLDNNAYYQILSYISCLYYQYECKKSLNGILLAYGSPGNSYEFKLDDKKSFQIHTEAIDLFDNENHIKIQLLNIIDNRLKYLV